MNAEEVQVAQGATALPGMTMAEMVRTVVTAVAPEELPLVAGLSRFDEADAGRRLADSTKRHDPLGSGLGEAAALVTPIIWLAVQEVVNRMADSAADSLLGRIRATVRKRLGRKKPAVRLPHFGEPELAEVRRLILEKAKQSGLKPGRAMLLAANA